METYSGGDKENVNAFTYFDGANNDNLTKNTTNTKHNI